MLMRIERMAIEDTTSVSTAKSSKPEISRYLPLRLWNQTTKIEYTHYLSSKIAVRTPRKASVRGASEKDRQLGVSLVRTHRLFDKL